jgi:hypothetical protein
MGHFLKKKTVMTIIFLLLVVVGIAFGWYALESPVVDMFSECVRFPKNDMVISVTRFDAEHEWSNVEFQQRLDASAVTTHAAREPHLQCPTITAPIPSTAAEPRFMMRHINAPFPRPIPGELLGIDENDTSRLSTEQSRSIEDATLPRHVASLRANIITRLNQSLSTTFRRSRSCDLRICHTSELTLYLWLDTIHRSKRKWIDGTLHHTRRSHGFQIEWTVGIPRASSSSKMQVTGKIVGNIVGPSSRIQAALPEKKDLVHAHTQYTPFPPPQTPLEPPFTQQRQILIDRLLKKQEVLDENQFRCVGQPMYRTQLSCISTTDFQGQPKRVGTWCRPCVQNKDCPFYRANQNYPNTFGGCKGGLCEMPLNVRRRGFRQFDPMPAPHCHNCGANRNRGPCCQQQAQKKNEYTLMASPDYVFLNDQRHRRKAQVHLHQRDLQ